MARYWAGGNRGPLAWRAVRLCGAGLELGTRRRAGERTAAAAHTERRGAQTDRGLRGDARTWWPSWEDAQGRIKTDESGKPEASGSCRRRCRFGMADGSVDWKRGATTDTGILEIETRAATPSSAAGAFTIERSMSTTEGQGDRDLDLYAGKRRRRLELIPSATVQARIYPPHAQGRQGGAGWPMRTSKRL